jgi:5-epi-alpha-selinene synthase
MTRLRAEQRVAPSRAGHAYPSYTGFWLQATKEDAMGSIVYPLLSCPFPSAINVHAMQAQQATIVWARRLHLLQRDVAYRRLNRLQYGLLMARAYPTAALEALQIVTDWSTWLFLLDDQCDEAGIGHDPERLADLHTRLLDVLHGASLRPRAEPLVYGLWDLYQRLEAHATENWLRRFRTSVAQYFSANVWEASNRRQGAIPDARTYCAMRPFTSAVYPCLLLIELTERLRIPSQVYDHPDVQRLAEMTNNVISWANDIVSLDKERQQGDVHNLALIFAHEHQLPLQAAVDRVGALHDAEVRAFTTLAAQLPTFEPAVDADLQRYVAGMRFWMRANLDWSLATLRYRTVSAHPALV